MASVGSYTVDTWTFKPGEPYGSGNDQDHHSLTVQSATLKPDGKTVELKISGLQLKYLVHIKLNGVTGNTGSGTEGPWGSETWFTLNAFGPGKVPAIAPCSDPDQYTGGTYAPDCGSTSVGELAQSAVHGLKALGSGRVSLSLPADQEYMLKAYDVLGAERKVWTGKGPADIDAGAAKLSPGLYFLSLRAGKYSGTLKLIQP